MTAAQRTSTSPRHLLVGGVAIAAGVAVLVTFAWALSRHNNPEYGMTYSDARYDCRHSSLREKCVVVVTVSNPYDHDVTVDYGNISGPLDRGGPQRIKLHGADGRVADARVYYATFPGRSTSLLRIHYDGDFDDMTAVSIDGALMELREARVSSDELRQAEMSLRS